MRLTPMRYKDFTWPHNPETYRSQCRREVAVHKIPFGGYVLQDLGPGCRVLEGEGTFAGRDAYETYRALEQVFAQSGPGLLVHPVWPAERAYFVTLELTEEPVPDLVRYRFAFWEDLGGYAGGLTEVAGGTSAGTAPPQSTAAAASQKTYRVCKGDTLWGIAGRCGVSLTALIAANPQIKNPNLIYPGETVVIP